MGSAGGSLLGVRNWMGIEGCGGPDEVKMWNN